MHWNLSNKKLLLRKIYCLSKEDIKIGLNDAYVTHISHDITNQDVVRCANQCARRWEAWIFLRYLFCRLRTALDGTSALDPIAPLSAREPYDSGSPVFTRIGFIRLVISISETRHCVQTSFRPLSRRRRGRIRKPSLTSLQPKLFRPRFLVITPCRIVSSIYNMALCPSKQHPRRRCRLYEKCSFHGWVNGKTGTKMDQYCRINTRWIS